LLLLHEREGARDRHLHVEQATSGTRKLMTARRQIRRTADLLRPQCLLLRSGGVVIVPADPGTGGDRGDRLAVEAGQERSVDCALQVCLQLLALALACPAAVRRLQAEQ